MDRWFGRVALVTGASSGIGEATARLLAHCGMKVVGCARRLEKLQQIASELTSAPGKFLPIKCDVTNEKETLAMFARIKSEWGGVDVCVNNAGTIRDAPLSSGDTAHWRLMLDLNVLALSVCTREAIKSMHERNVDDGHVIHMNSIVGHWTINSPYVNFYTATKCAVTALTVGLRNELRAVNSHIRITSVSPGCVETELLMYVYPNQPEALQQKYHGGRRRMDPKDIADAVLYALSCPPHVQVHEMIVRATEDE